MAVRHDAPKELDPRAIAWTALAAGKLVGIQLLTSQLNNWLSAVHNANRFRAKRGDYSFELPEDRHGHYLPNDGERNLIMSEDALYNRLTLVMDDKATRLSLVQPGEIPDGWVELVEFGGFGTSHVAYLILPNKSRVVCASKDFGWLLGATRPDDFTISLPITKTSARHILAAVLSEEEGDRIWP